MANQDQLLLELAGGIERLSHQAERLLGVVQELRDESLGTERPDPRVLPINGAVPVAPLAAPVLLDGTAPSKQSVYDYFTELDDKICALRRNGRQAPTTGTQQVP